MSPLGHRRNKVTPINKHTTVQDLVRITPSDMATTFNQAKEWGCVDKWYTVVELIARGNLRNPLLQMRAAQAKRLRDEYNSWDDVVAGLQADIERNLATETWGNKLAWIEENAGFSADRAQIVLELKRHVNRKGAVWDRWDQKAKRKPTRRFNPWRRGL